MNAIHAAPEDQPDTQDPDLLDMFFSHDHPYTHSPLITPQVGQV